MPLKEGSVLGNRYRLLSQIGRGGMGRVWHAYDDLLHRDVAAKEVIFPYELMPSEREELFERMLREARSAARLSHPGIVTVHDVVEDDGRPWIVMEFVRAPSLQDLIDRHGRLPVHQVAWIGVQMLGALRTAHAAGILHRDIKPANVLLDTTSAGHGHTATRAVITDFGIARTEGESALTRPGKVLGSPAYIAPERVLGQPAGPASDLWALGATLYAACEGRAPHERDDVMATLAAIVHAEAAPPRQAGALTPVLMGLLASDPAVRMTADQATAALTSAAGVSPPLTRAVDQRRHTNGEAARRRGRARLLLITAAVLAAVAGVALLVPRLYNDARSASSDVPPGFVKAAGPAGTSVAVPDGWTEQVLSRDSTKWTEDATGAYVQIDAIPWGATKSADHWRDITPTMSARLPRFQQLGITDRGDLRGWPVADLEFTWLKQGRGSMRACDRGFTANGHQYAILIAAPAAQWTKYSDFVNSIFYSFQPAAR